VPETVRIKGYGGIDLAVHHLGGSGPPVMLAHATGFHGRCWTPLARALTPSYTVWAIDQRGHGESGKAPGDYYGDWSAFAADLLAAVDAIGGDGWRAGGHSLGGGVTLLAEARRPGTFQTIACYEPVAMPPTLFSGPEGGPGSGGVTSAIAAGPVPAERGLPPIPGRNPLAALARKRRPVFESRPAAYDNYRSKPPFAAFDAEALHCYVDYGFVDQPDGTVTLACRREDEAAVFEGALANPTWSELPNVRAPVAVMAGGDMNDPVARVAASVAQQIRRGGLIRFDRLDHFGPMTAPTEVGEAMARAFAGGEAMNGTAGPEGRAAG
jgi:pimeloyl-ACP methyl ester carboxylesterase